MKNLFRNIMLNFMTLVLGIVLGTVIATIISAGSDSEASIVYDSTSLELPASIDTTAHLFLPADAVTTVEDQGTEVDSESPGDSEENSTADQTPEPVVEEAESVVEELSETELLTRAEQAYQNANYVAAYMDLSECAERFENPTALNLASHYKGLAMNQMKDAMTTALTETEYATAYDLADRINAWDEDDYLYFDHVLSLFNLMAVTAQVQEHIEKNPAYNISGLQADFYNLAGGAAGLQAIELDCKYALSQVDELEDYLLTYLDEYESIVNGFHSRGYDTTWTSPVYEPGNILWLRDTMGEIRTATQDFDDGIDAVQRYEKLVKKEEDGKLKDGEFEELNALEPQVQYFLNSLARQGTVPTSLSSGIAGLLRQLEYYSGEDFASRQFQYYDNRIAANLPLESLKERITSDTNVFLGASEEALNGLGDPVSSEEYDIHSLFLKTVQHGYWIGDNYYNFDVHHMDQVVNAINFETTAGLIDFPYGDTYYGLTKSYGDPTFAGYLDIFRANGTGYDWWVYEYVYEDAGITLTFISDDFDMPVRYVIVYNQDYNRDGQKRR